MTSYTERHDDRHYRHGESNTFIRGAARIVRAHRPGWALVLFSSTRWNASDGRRCALTLQLPWSACAQGTKSVLEVWANRGQRLLSFVMKACR
jgi:hypothetical protein